MRLFSGDSGMAIAIDRLQIARMVDLVRRPAPGARLGLADDMVHLIGNSEPQPPALALWALA